MRASPTKSAAPESGQTVADRVDLCVCSGFVSLGRERVTIGSAAVYVGRAEGCALKPADRKVSAVHLELVATERGIRVRDLASRNGTYLGSVRITEVFVKSGARIRVGDTELEVTNGEPQVSSVAAVTSFGALVGGPSLWPLFDQLRAVAATDLSVLLMGETGCGKEVTAREIHRASKRAAGPFIVVDCGAIPASLAEGLLFGHERGAFTGANERKVGPFVQAHGGTLFLDELGELTPAMQPKLLRVIAERVVQPVGSQRYQPVDVRVIAATRRHLANDVNRGEFRSDLFFRVAQVVVRLPPLRERLDDLALLVRSIMADLGRSAAVDRLTPGSLDRLGRHDWPGNVRELKNVLDAASALTPEGPIDLEKFLASTSASHEARDRVRAEIASTTYKDAKRDVLDRFEREYFSDLYAKSGRNLSEMSRRADLHRDYVRRYLVRHGISAAKK